jgi:hypothetical protein
MAIVAPSPFAMTCVLPSSLLWLIVSSPSLRVLCLSQSAVPRCCGVAVGLHRRKASLFATMLCRRFQAQSKWSPHRSKKAFGIRPDKQRLHTGRKYLTVSVLVLGLHSWRGKVSCWTMPGEKKPLKRPHMLTGDCMLGATSEWCPLQPGAGRGFRARLGQECASSVLQGSVWMLSHRVTLADRTHDFGFDSHGRSGEGKRA